MGLREQLGSFLDPPKRKRKLQVQATRRPAGGSRKRRSSPTAGRVPASTGLSVVDGVPRVNQTERHACDVCERETTWACYKLSRGRGQADAAGGFRLLELFITRDMHESTMKAAFSAGVDDAQYVAFWLCTERGHVERETRVA